MRLAAPGRVVGDGASMGTPSFADFGRHLGMVYQPSTGEFAIYASIARLRIYSPRGLCRRSAAAHSLTTLRRKQDGPDVICPSDCGHAA